MSIHRLDLCTLTAETAWKEYIKRRVDDRMSARLALMTHFTRIDERARAKGLDAFFTRHDLDHTAKGNVR